MPRARDPSRGTAFQIYKENSGNIDLIEIASRLNLPPGTIRGWKAKDKWEQQLNGTFQMNTERSKRKKGGQPGNKNASGPPENGNAVKHGLFEKYLPKETLDIVNNMSLKPLDILWDQIQIAYAAIVRAQQINYVKDINDKTTNKVGQKDGDTVTEERWEVQEAWDKQNNFMKAQARAQSELRSMIKQYDEMLNHDWQLVTEEQKARIALLKARVDNPAETGTEDDGFLDALESKAEEVWADEDDNKSV